MPPKSRWRRFGRTAPARPVAFIDRGDYLESVEDVPEPHAFRAKLRIVQAGWSREFQTAFAEHDHGSAGGDHHRDNNMRAVFVHVIADAAVLARLSVFDELDLVAYEAKDTLTGAIFDIRSKNLNVVRFFVWLFDHGFG